MRHSACASLLPSATDFSSVLVLLLINQKAHIRPAELTNEAILIGTANVTPFMKVALNGDADILQRSVSSKKNIKKQDRNGMPDLMHSAKQGHIEPV